MKNKRSLPWLPLDVDQLIGDPEAIDASTEEVGALILLRCFAWKSKECDLSLHDEKLASLARMPLDRWMAIRESVLNKLDPSGAWSQPGKSRVTDLSSAESRAHADRVSKARSHPKTHQTSIGSTANTNCKPIANQLQTNKAGPVDSYGPDNQAFRQSLKERIDESTVEACSPNLNQLVNNCSANDSLAPQTSAKLDEAGTECVFGGKSAEIPSIDEVITECSLRGIPEDCGKKFFYDRDATCWELRGTRIANWRSSLRSYAMSWRGYDLVSQKKPRAAFVARNQRRDGWGEEVAAARFAAPCHEEVELE